jgi:hypothetical protein
VGRRALGGTVASAGAGLGDGEASAVGAGLGEGAGDSVAGAGLGEGESEGEGEATAAGLGDGEGEATAAGLGEGKGEGVAAGAEAGLAVVGVVEPAANDPQTICWDSLEFGVKCDRRRQPGGRARQQAGLPHARPGRGTTHRRRPRRSRRW